MGKNNKKRHGTPTLNEFSDHTYIPHARARKRSWRLDEKIILRHVSPRFGNTPIGEITCGDIEEWLNGLLESGMAASSCNRILYVLKTMFTIAESRGQLQSGTSPCKSVRAFSTGESREKFLTKSEGEALMRLLTQNPNIRARALQLILLTGARKNEILKAKWEYVDMEQRLLKVPISKSNKTRHIVLSDAALEILRNIPRNSKWIFPGRDPNKPIGDIFSFWEKIRNKAGLGNVRIHDLRHTFASYLVNGGHSLYEVQKLLGHSDPRTTMRYAHLDKGPLINATNDVGELLAGSSLIH